MVEMAYFLRILIPKYSRRPITISTSIIPKFIPALKMPAMAAQPVKRVERGNKRAATNIDFFMVFFFEF